MYMSFKSNFFILLVLTCLLVRVAMATVVTSRTTENPADQTLDVALNKIQNFTKNKSLYCKITTTGPNISVLYENYIYNNDNQDFNYLKVTQSSPFPCTYIVYKHQNGDHVAFFPSKLLAVTVITAEEENSLINLMGPSVTSLISYLRSGTIANNGNGTSIASLELDVNKLKEKGLFPPEIESFTMEISFKESGEIIKITQTLASTIITSSFQFITFDNSTIKDLAPQIPTNIAISTDKTLQEILLEFQLNYLNSTNLKNRDKI